MKLQNIHKLCFLLIMQNQLSHPYKATSKFDFCTFLSFVLFAYSFAIVHCGTWVAVYVGWK